MIKTNPTVKVGEKVGVEPLRLLVLFEKGQEDITKIIADVLGHKHYLTSRSGGNAQEDFEDIAVVGIEHGSFKAAKASRETTRIVVTTHCVDIGDTRDQGLIACCDYEYLYTNTIPIRKDLARFLGFVLGQNQPHEELRKKHRTTSLAMTFQDVREALPNLDILSVGADAVELRVDLLRDPAVDSDLKSVPGMSYVGEQVMLLRQRTGLPIIFTTRCTNENGRFPMNDPALYYKYLRKAIQWGCEYIDVEVWLPAEIRRQLAAEKRSTRIIAASHDYSGTFKWSAPRARELFEEAIAYGDVVKMCALVHTVEDNFELEHFRSMIQNRCSRVLFSGLNMGSVGQLSRTLNKVFTPVTHPLLPMLAAPGQLSAAETNCRLSSMGRMPRLDIGAFGDKRGNGLAIFFGKCLNELSQPHQLVPMERPSHRAIETFIAQSQFGGAYFNPSLPVDHAPYLPTLTEAASAIGQIDTIAVRSTHNSRTLFSDNVAWKGIRATLTSMFVPAAYAGRSALILGNSEASAAAAIYALTTLNIGSIHTIGFSANQCHQLQGIEELRRVEEPFIVISALPAEKSMVVLPVLKHYTQGVQGRFSKVFVDLSRGTRGRNDAVAIADSLGWVSHSGIDLNAGTIVETLRLLVGENVPCDFVRLAGGKSLCA